MPLYTRRSRHARSPENRTTDSHSPRKAIAYLFSDLFLLAVVSEHTVVAADVDRVGRRSVPSIPVSMAGSSTYQGHASVWPDEQNVLAWVRDLTRYEHLTTGHCDAENVGFSSLERILLAIWRSSAMVFTDGLLVRSRFSCGFCHQRAYLLFELLRARGIEAIVFGLEGHVVTRFVLNQRTFIADPDYGVGPFEYSESASELMRVVHTEYSAYDEELQGRLADMYTSFENNGIFPVKGGLDALRSRQEEFFMRAKIVAGLLFLAAVGLLGGGIRTHLRSS